MNDSELDQLLKDCGTSMQTPAAFQRDVWFRIEAAEATLAVGWLTRANRILERFLGFVAMPPVAVATCSAMALAGAWFGLESAKSTIPNEISYVHSISPFTQTHR